MNKIHKWISHQIFKIAIRYYAWKRDLFRKKEVKYVNVIKANPAPFEPKTPQPHHMSESKLYKPRNAYSKRMWNNNKPLPKNFKDEDEDD